MLMCVFICLHLQQNAVDLEKFHLYFNSVSIQFGIWWNRYVESATFGKDTIIKLVLTL